MVQWGSCGSSHAQLLPGYPILQKRTSDAWGGVPSTTIGVCARYIHSHQTLYAMDDFLEAQAFLQALVKKLDRSTVDLIKHY